MGDVNGLFENIIVPVIVTIVSASLTFLGFWRKAKAELEQEYLKRFNDKKWEIYTHFTKMLQHLIVKDTQTGSRDIETDLVSQFVMIGSDDVLLAMREWRLAGSTFGNSADETRERLYILLIQMRNDLGIKHSKIGVDEILDVLVPGTQNN